MTTKQRDVPQLVVHADWSSDRKKRWMTVAALEKGVYRIEPPELVGDVGGPIQGVRRRAGDRQVLLGFDFPIGVPQEYAKLAGISSFLAVLIELGEGRWARFYEIAESAAEISLHRPFYPRRPGGTSQSHLVRGLGVADMNDLLRRCDRSHGGRGPSCSLFWTLGDKKWGALLKF